MIDLVAHRGASSEEPENTLSAFKRAIEIGVDFIELDVHLSKDQVPVVIHDSTLCRTTDAAKGTSVRDTSAKELKQFDAGSWFKGERTDETVPTLEEVLELPLDGVGLMLELKDDVENDLSEAVARLLDRHKPKNILIASFSRDTLSYFVRKRREQPLIALVEKREEVPLLKKLPLKHWAVDHSLFGDATFEGELFDVEKLWAFTVNDPHTALKLLAFGVEGIITNHPRALKELAKSPTTRFY